MQGKTKGYAYSKDSNGIKIGVVPSHRKKYDKNTRGALEKLRTHLPPKQLKDKTFFTADVEEALLYAPTLALNLQWSPRTNRGCSTELTAVMSHVCVTNRSDHKGVEIKEKFNADRHKDLFLCALLIRRFYDYRGLLGDRQGINTGPF